MFDPRLTGEHTFAILGFMSRTCVRWRRVVPLGLGVALAIGVVGSRAGAGTERPAAPVVHVVRSGETLWAIARGIVGAAGDPRPVVDRLIETNHLSGRDLDPGRRLILPSG